MSELDRFGGWPALLTQLLDREDLTEDQARAAMATILSGDATPAQLIGFVVALRAKGETADELTGLLGAALAEAAIVPLTEHQRSTALDVVGTGGDQSNSINVSTMAALVVAAAGVPVCKHGARAASSKCGTADVLETLGLAVELSPEAVKESVDRTGFGFCFAPRFHPAFRFAAPSRREIGIPTVFNMLGPMANPGLVRRRLIGVAVASYADRMLVPMQRHGVTDAWIVHGDGLDELSTTAPSTVTALSGGNVTRFTVDAVDYDMPRVTPAALVGGDRDENADAVRRVLAGDRGPHRDIVVLNAGAALVIAGRSVDLAAGIELAGTSIDSGQAAATLDAVAEVTRELAARSAS